LRKEEETEMRKRFLTLFIAVFTGLLFLAVGILSANVVTPPPDEVLIQNLGYKKDKKGPVLLTHKRHVDTYNVTCTDCHHDYKDGKNMWNEGMPVKKCSACHDPLKKQGKVMKLNSSYHRNCKSCHKEICKTDKSKHAPYKKCTKCHQKKS